MTNLQIMLSAAARPGAALFLLAAARALASCIKPLIPRGRIKDALFEEI